MKRIIAVILCVVLFFSVMVPVVAAEGTTEFQLEINPENRYTDISEMDEYDKKIFANEIQETEQKDGNKIVYIVVLCVLLVVAIVVLIVSLKRVPPEESVDSVSDKNKKSAKDSIKNEEKSDDKEIKK